MSSSSTFETFSVDRLHQTLEESVHPEIDAIMSKVNDFDHDTGANFLSTQLPGISALENQYLLFGISCEGAVCVISIDDTTYDFAESTSSEFSDDGLNAVDRSLDLVATIIELLNALAQRSTPDSITYKLADQVVKVSTSFASFLWEDATKTRRFQDPDGAMKSAFLAYTATAKQGFHA